MDGVGTSDDPVGDNLTPARTVAACVRFSPLTFASVIPCERKVDSQPMESIEEAVERLLTESLAAHVRARQMRHEGNKANGSRNWSKRNDDLTLARDLRMEAHAMDPAHAAPFWATENPGHETMMLFYQRQLGK